MVCVALMAPRSAAGPPSPALPSSSGLARTGGAHRPPVFSRQPSCRRLRAGCVRAAQDDEAPPVVRVAVSAVTELLRVLSPSKKQPRDSVQEVEELAPPLCGSVEDVLAVLQDDYRRAYFLTGDFTPGIYTEDCLFEDPTIKFRGRSRYSQNLNLLVPFFDSPSLELENIEKCRWRQWEAKALWNSSGEHRKRPHEAAEPSGTFAKMLSRISSWFVNPRRNPLARMHRNAVAARLRKYGLRYDDLYDPYHDLDIKEALARLPREVVDARIQRLKRAMDLSMKHQYLPDDLQAIQTPFRSYLSDMLALVKKERAEREALGALPLYQRTIP